MPDQRRNKPQHSGPPTAKKKGKPRPKPQAQGAPKSESAVANLIKGMDGLKTADALNDKAIQPFIKALEDICRARGYVMNIYTDGANLIVTGDSESSEAVYEIVDNYLDARGVGDGDN